MSSQVLLLYLRLSLTVALFSFLLRSTTSTASTILLLLFENICFFVHLITLLEYPIYRPVFFGQRMNMADIIRRQNEPLMADPSIFHHPDATRVNTSVTGSDWYWVITIIMTLFTSIVLILASRVTRGNRIFHHMTVGITLVPSITYFMMASNLGWADVHVEFIRSKDLAVGTYRQVFYVRHLEGFVTTPVRLQWSPLYLNKF